MPRRIDVELTSERADGTWTWRAAGAKQPKGEVAVDLAVRRREGRRRRTRRRRFRRGRHHDHLGATAEGEAAQRARAHRGDRHGARTSRPSPPRSSRRVDVASAAAADAIVAIAVIAVIVRIGARAVAARRVTAIVNDARYRPRPGWRAATRTTPASGASGPTTVEAKPKPKRLRPGRAHRQAVVADLPEEHKADRGTGACAAASRPCARRSTSRTKRTAPRASPRSTPRR